MVTQTTQPPSDLAGYHPIPSAGDCWYDPIAAEHAVRFIEQYCVHVKGRWANQLDRSFILAPWQRDIVRTIFGWKRPDGARRYRTVYCEVPRKNGKSSLVAAIALYLLLCDNEAGAEIYCAASDKDQAALVFNVAAQMVRKVSALSSRCKIRDSVKRIIKDDSFLRAIPCETGGSHGFNSHGILADELHAWPATKGHEFWGVLETSVGARDQPLFIAITTAGYDRHSVCWEQHKYASRVRDGKVDDPEFLPVIYAADEKDDWTDPEVWAKANPNLGVSLSLDYLKRKCRVAQEIPAKENEFRRLHLDQWTSQKTRFIQMADWRACREPWREELAGRQCFGGIDLSTKTALTAWVMVFPWPDDTIDAVPHFWIPEDAVDRLTKQDGVPYAQWIKAGLVHATPGDRVDYAFIRKQIVADSERYKIEEIGYDPWQAEDMRQILENEHGLTMVEVRQGVKSLSAPMKDLEARAKTGTLRHAGHPVMEWNADCLECKTDENGNIRPIRPEHNEAGKKIDGMVALIMALNRMMVWTDQHPTFDASAFAY